MRFKVHHPGVSDWQLYALWRAERGLKQIPIPPGAVFVTEETGFVVAGAGVYPYSGATWISELVTAPNCTPWQARPACILILQAALSVGSVTNTHVVARPTSKAMRCGLETFGFVPYTVDPSRELMICPPSMTVLVADRKKPPVPSIPSTGGHAVTNEEIPSPPKVRRPVARGKKK